jgi:hypothetical protein
VGVLFDDGWTAVGSHPAGRPPDGEDRMPHGTRGHA